jgi:DNA replication and repair protein RecF
LLEAIYVVATLRSFRTARLTELVAFGGERGRLAARVLDRELVRVYEVELAPGTRRVRLDGKAVRPLSRYFGGFNVVVFTPEDLALPRGAPADRRRFLDRGVFTLDPGYLSVASDYDKVLRTRNTVLRQAQQGTLSTRRVDELLDIYDEQLAHLAVESIASRSRFLGLLAPELRAAFAAITRTSRVAGVHYASKLAGLPAEEITRQLRDVRARDLAMHATSLGPHRDDVVFELDGHSAGSFASQGQLRAIMLAWKTAELTIFGRAHGDAPILLLDDVSSELDATRNEYLFEHLAGLAGQCFITTTAASHVLVHDQRVDYQLRAGQIVV